MFNQVGETYARDAFGSTDVGDTHLARMFLSHDGARFSFRRRKRNYERVTAGTALYRIDEPRIAGHDTGQMRLASVINFDEKRFLAGLAPFEKLVVLFRYFVEYFD
nr:hypothetical protein [Mesorhizobium sp.]